MRYLYIVTGGAIGSLLRYFFTGVVHEYYLGLFPLGTLIINISGSFFIGFFWRISERFFIPTDMRMFLFIGLLGSFTTFSTFTMESFSLMRDGEFRYAFVNVLVSALLGLIMVYLGYSLGKYFSILIRPLK